MAANYLKARPMTAGTNSGVSIRSTCKCCGDLGALDSIILHVVPSEFISLLEPSGSGKSTLVGILGRFIQPSSASIWIGDRDITYIPPHKRDIGIIFQNYALFPHMTQDESVAFPLRTRRLPKSSWAGKVAGALAMVELRGYEGRRISQLFGDQRRRVASTGAIAFEPRLILMDEPLLALDNQLRETMQIELRHLHKKLGATTIYVTHDQREALTLSHRVATLRNGRMVKIGAPDQLHDHPVDSFVASFIGEATLMPGARAGAQEVKLGELILRSARPVPPEGEILLAVQTEKLLIDDGHWDACQSHSFPRHGNRVPGRKSENLRRDGGWNQPYPSAAQPLCRANANPRSRPTADGRAQC